MSLRECIKQLTAENTRLRAALEDIRDNWDCDSDAHRYGTSCRCCLAKEALEGTTAKTNLPSISETA